MSTQVNIGDILTCHETGEQFVAALSGCTTNYAMDSEGRVYSDLGAFQADARALAERKGPFVGYVGARGDLTTWKGQVLAQAWHSCACKLTRTSFMHSARSYRSYWFRAPDGGLWYGRGSVGLSIKVRPVKGE